MNGLIRLSLATLAVWIGIAAIIALFFRYDFYPAHESTVIWRTDRLSGGIELCYSNAGRIQCEAYSQGQPYRP